MNIYTHAPVAESISRWKDPVTGLRFYGVKTPDGREIGLPGVTSILGYTSSTEDRERLEKWRAREVAAGRDPDAAANRGTQVHACLEAILRGRTPEYPNKEIEDFARGMYVPLQTLESILWS